MTLVGITTDKLESLSLEFFQSSVGQWKSQRRYYTLDRETQPQEVESSISIQFLPQGAPELIELARLHQLEWQVLVGGTKVSWSSNYTGVVRKPSNGSTVFGVWENRLYRDRGFATTEPVIAVYNFTNPQTMSLRTEYNDSVFEEEIKLVGRNYRTRQSIISRAGQELLIGQYLEKRLEN